MMSQLRLLRNQDSTFLINSSVSYTVFNSDSFVLKMNTPCFSLFHIMCVAVVGAHIEHGHAGYS